MPATFTTGDNNFSGYQWIVDPTSGKGTQTTIQAAIDAASAGDTILVRSKTTAYLENLTLKDSVYVIASNDSNPGPVIIKGNISTPTSGSVNCFLQGFHLQTNGGNQITVGGSNTVGLWIYDCYFGVADHDQISMTNTTGTIVLDKCNGNTTNGFKFHTITGGSFNVNFCAINSATNYTTVSTISAGTIVVYNSQWSVPIKSTGTATVAFRNIRSTVGDVINMDLQGSGNNEVSRSSIANVTASAAAINIATGCLLLMRGNVTVICGATNVITGAGTAALTLSNIDFIGGSGITVPVINSSQSTLGTLVTTASVSTPSITINGGSALTTFSQGTFSPTIRGTSTAGTVTMTNQGGRYQKTGRLVTLCIAVDWSTIGGATGGVECNNLPFTCANISNNENCSLAVPHVNNLASASGAVTFMEPVQNTATSVIYYFLGSTGGNTVTTITATNGFNTTLTYETT